MVEKITVTPEMSERILKSLSEINFEKEQPNAKKTTPISRFLSVAACFVVLVFGVTLSPQIFNSVIEPPVQIIPDITEYETLEELSAIVVYPLLVPSVLPKDMKETSYFYFWKSIAEITYSNESNVIVYRMAKGKDDISGDYNKYSSVKEYETGNGTITLQGNESGYNLAVWKNDNFSFSLSSVKPLTEDEFLQIALSVR